jgi:hypothetical protein
MMTIEKFAKYLGAEPFRPFRINMASGRSFEIRHPEMIQVGKSTVTIFTYLSDDEEEAKQRQHDVSMLLIESLEPLDTKAAAGNN